MEPRLEPGEADSFADHLTRRLIGPNSVGVRDPTPEFHDHWVTMKLSQMSNGGKTSRIAWTDYLAGWSVMRPVRIHVSYERPAPHGSMYGDILFRTHSPDSDEYTNKIINLVARAHRITGQMVVTDSVVNQPGAGVDVACPTPYPTKSSATDDWMRAVIRWLVLHELDEFIVLRGERVYHPHRQGDPSPHDF